MSFHFLEDSKYWKGAELECVVRDFSMFIKDEGFRFQLTYFPVSMVSVNPWQIWLKTKLQIHMVRYVDCFVVFHQVDGTMVKETIVQNI